MVDIPESNEYWSHPPNPVGLDRCRCYRHFGVKSRSPGVAGCEKERVIVPGGGRRNRSISFFGSDVPAFQVFSKYSQTEEISQAVGHDTRIRNPRVGGICSTS